MTETDPIVSAAVFDFLQDLEDDVLHGEARPLSSYLARYPEAESEVAAEYLRQTQAATPRRAGVDLGANADREDKKERYRIIEPLGQGGQGTVYLAEDIRLGRRVALKQLDGRWITPTRRLRFQREAEIVARIDHPAIAEVLDADFDASEPFIIMRYVKGADLASELRRAKAGEHGLMPVQPKTVEELHEVLRFFESVANALHVAHEAGVVHRDVKPGNLMVAPDGQAAVLDFGLAMEAKSDALTREGEGMGTPEYMAPEQISEAVGDIDRRTDIHALGLVLFEVLTGKRPFQGSTIHVIHGAILDAERPSLRQNDRSFPRDLSIVVATAFDRNPTRRYATAASFAGDLRRVRVVEPILARPAGAWLKFRRWAQREPALSAALLVLIVSLSLGLIQSKLSIRERVRLIEEKQTILKLKDSALSQKEVALRQEKQALDILGSQLFSGRSEDRVNANPSAALALALHATELNSSKATRSAIYSPLSRSRLQRRFRGTAGGNPSSPSLSANGEWLLATAGEAAVLAMSVEGDGRQVVELPLKDVADGSAIVAAGWVDAPDDFVVATDKGHVIRWRSGEIAWQIQLAGAVTAIESTGDQVRLSIDGAESVSLAMDSGKAAGNSQPLAASHGLIASIDDASQVPQIVVHRAQEGGEVLRADVAEGLVLGPLISLDGQLVACALNPGRLLAWSIASGELVLDERGDFVPESLKWVWDSRRLLVTTRSGNVYLWRTEPIPELVQLQESGAEVKLCAFLEQGASALVVCADGASSIYSVRSEAQPLEPRDHAMIGSARWRDPAPTEVSRAAAAANTDRWVLAHSSLDVEYWGWPEAEDAPLAMQRTRAQGPIAELLISDEADQVAWRLEDGTAFLWRPGEGPQGVRKLSDDASSICLAHGRAGAYLGQESGDIHCPDGSILKSPFKESAGHAALALSVSPDGKKLAAGYFPYFVAVWEVATGNRVGPGVLVSRIGKIEWSKSSELIALGTEEGGGTLRTLVVGAKKAVAWSIPRQAGVVDLAAGGPRNEFLVACRNGEAFFFDGGKEPRVFFPLHSSPLTCVAMSPGVGDARAISGDEAGCVYVWPLDPEAAAERRIARRVDEWERRLIRGPLTEPPTTPR